MSIDGRSETSAGIFPHGPTQKMAAHRDRVIEHIIGTLMRARNTALMSGPSDLDNYMKAATITFGKPGTCMVCDMRFKPVSSDIDAWFCSLHCPACRDWTATLDEQ